MTEIIMSPWAVSCCSPPGYSLPHKPFSNSARNGLFVSFIPKYHQKSVSVIWAELMIVKPSLSPVFLLHISTSPLQMANLFFSFSNKAKTLFLRVKLWWWYIFLPAKTTLVFQIKECKCKTRTFHFLLLFTHLKKSNNFHSNAKIAPPCLCQRQWSFQC